MNDSTETQDILLARSDGSAKKFRIYGRPMPGLGEILTLPVDGRLVKARVVTSSTEAEGVELVESGELEVL